LFSKITIIVKKLLLLSKTLFGFMAKPEIRFREPHTYVAKATILPYLPGAAKPQRKTEFEKRKSWTFILAKSAKVHS